MGRYRQPSIELSDDVCASQGVELANRRLYTFAGRLSWRGYPMMTTAMKAKQQRFSWVICAGAIVAKTEAHVRRHIGLIC